MEKSSAVSTMFDRASIANERCVAVDGSAVVLNRICLQPAEAGEAELVPKLDHAPDVVRYTTVSLTCALLWYQAPTV